MITAADLDADAAELERLAARVRALIGKTSKPAFMTALDAVESQCKQIRARVVQHSRGIRQGVRGDGKPDMRFRQNRESGGTKLDLRRSRQ